MSDGKVEISHKGRFKRSLPYIIIALPAAIYMFLFSYLPMFGIVIAFKDYTYAGGILGSRWAGFKHFEYFFTSNDAFRVLRNTILYNIASLLLVGLFFGMLVALMLYEVRSKLANKIYQTTMLLPFFLSWVIISGMALLFLNPSSGLINSLLEAMGHKGIAWYSEAKYWPFIICFVMIWKDAGMASLYFYAALLAIDTSLFEAASLDGAGRLRQIWYVSVPQLAPMACITIINRLGHIFSADLGLYYQLTMDSGPLYPTTDVLATFMLRGLQGGSMSATAAVGLFQSVVGLILILGSNAIIKKINSENAMF